MAEVDGPLEGSSRSLGVTLLSEEQTQVVRRFRSTVQVIRLNGQFVGSSRSSRVALLMEQALGRSTPPERCPGGRIDGPLVGGPGSLGVALPSEEQPQVVRCLRSTVRAVRIDGLLVGGPGSLGVALIFEQGP